MNAPRITLVLLAAMAGVISTACNRSEGTRIVVIPKATAHVFWQTVHAGASAAGKESGVEIEWLGPAAETDFARQIEIVDSAITSRADGIVLAPTEATSLVGVAERAAREGVPLVVFDSGIDTEDYVSFVATNNYEAGAKAARELGALLTGTGTVAMVKNVAGSSSTMQREKGFEDTLATEFPQIEKVAEQYCSSDVAKALAAAENILTAHPDLDALFASAEPATVGVGRALRGRNLTGKVKFVGFDFSEAIEEDLRAGVIDALIVQDPFNIGYQAVKAVLAKIAGETPAKRIDTPATVVTGENVDTPEIDRLVHPDLTRGG
ncbi:MAG: substrate-binding domain-containing protein [Acidobacteria bacterium]|nr:substrate-binding domain-containing protein [Acidobacteriota bacterium]MDA1233399.1 substrate-binding domain-containing protein [Acidobacteriota bacterium]